MRPLNGILFWLILVAGPVSAEQNDDRNFTTIEKTFAEMIAGVAEQALDSHCPVVADGARNNDSPLCEDMLRSLSEVWDDVTQDCRRSIDSNEVCNIVERTQAKIRARRIQRELADNLAKSI
ncbi:hypothetical protein GCM10022278_38060 [Allohahella marinimesophila]|uniref:UrcA family protein n=1 Tax=Allohahella marinimesophila TaxID=1054972 RepID=A0ABP7Q715_9GAMM